MQSLESSHAEAGQGRRRYARRVLVVVLGLSVAAVASYLFFHRLGVEPLLGDEAIHAEVAREMAAGESWLPPTFAGDVYTAKPPLKILAVAWIFRHFGVSELHARVLDAGLGVATVLQVFGFGVRRFGPWPAALAALLLATAPLYVTRHGVREGVQDSALVFLLTAALMLYARYLEAGRARRLDLLGAAVAVGLAMLVKGAAALLVLPVLAAWEVVIGRAAAERGGAGARIRERLRGPAVVALVAAVFFLPYVAAVQDWTGGRFGPRFYRDVVVRATEALDPHHVHGPLFYLRQLGSELGPWLLAALPALAALVAPTSGRCRVGERERTALLLCGLWVATLLLVLNLSTSKLAWYLYPAYPALALFLAGGVGVTARWVARRRPAGPAGLAGAVLGAALATLALAGIWHRVDRLEERIAAEPPDDRVVRYARAMAGTRSPRLAILRDAQVEPGKLFYLLPYGRRAYSVPIAFRTEDADSCRYLIRGRPDLPPVAHPAPNARALPLEWPEPQNWLQDLDGCLPPWV